MLSLLEQKIELSKQYLTPPNAIEGQETTTDTEIDYRSIETEIETENNNQQYGE